MIKVSKQVKETLGQTLKYFKFWRSIRNVRRDWN